MSRQIETPSPARSLVEISEDEVIKKIASINSSYTRDELIRNRLFDVLGYLVALRDGHDYRIDIYGAIATVKDTLELLDDDKI